MAICYFCPPGRGGRRQQVGKEGPWNLSSGNEKEGDGPKRQRHAIHQPDGREGETRLPCDRPQGRTEAGPTRQPNAGTAGQPDACSYAVAKPTPGRPGRGTAATAGRSTAATQKARVLRGGRDL